jgi:uncharacterized protein (TIGR03118 family)
MILLQSEPLLSFARARRCRTAAAAMALALSWGIFPASLAADDQSNQYAAKILVANRPGFDAGAMIDEHLVNPWGIALRPPGAGGHIWVSNASNASTSTFVGDAGGTPLHQDGLKLVPLDGPRVSYEDGVANVTGQAYNIASDFPGQEIEFPVSGPGTDLSKNPAVPLGVIHGSAKFVFVTTDGTINAWRSGTTASMNSAVIVKDYSDHGPDQIRGLAHLPAFTGVAMSALPRKGNRLYVADFQNRTIRVLDARWNDVTAAVPFEHPANLPLGYGPFNIQLLENRLYVAFAELDADAEEPATDLPAPGAGRVVAYDLDGRIVKEFASTPLLNSPWGLAIAPKDFGPFAGALLVGNFGDGTIVAFDATSGAVKDILRDASGEPIRLDGLWGLSFGNGVSLGDADSLYFAAGPNGEQDGIFGRIRHAVPAKNPTPSTKSEFTYSTSIGTASR